MKAITLSATFDGEHIRLEENFPLTKNARLLVTVLPDDLDSERQEWTAFAMQGLARAYGDHEPEYPDSCVREPNPKYEGRKCHSYAAASGRRTG